MDESTARRFWAKVDVRSADECWLWTASTNTAGYGQFWLDTRQLGAHRVAYEALVGPIPDGLQIDHLCRVKNCLNPAHMEPVTQRVNLLRGDTVPAANAVKAHCPQGHPYDAANTYHWRRQRRCRECNRHRQREYMARKRRRL